MNAKDTLHNIEDMGRQRASKSSDIWEEFGRTPEDNFSCDDMTIWNPWMSDCGRFEVNPYKVYGKPFVLWLLRPFYVED